MESRSGRTRPGLIIAAFAGLGVAPATAEENKAPLTLDPIVVVASKRPVALSEVAGQISVLTGPELADQLTEAPDKALRHEPEVSIGTGSTRFGSDAFVLRGVGGNRVAAYRKNNPPFQLISQVMTSRNRSR